MNRYFVLESEVEAKKISNIFELLEIRPSEKEAGELQTVGISLGSGEVWKQSIFSCAFITPCSYEWILKLVVKEKPIYRWLKDKESFFVPKAPEIEIL